MNEACTEVLPPISELILKGAKKYPGQTHHKMLKLVNNEIHTSALGAILVALDEVPADLGIADMSIMFMVGLPMLKMIECPDGRPRTLFAAMEFMNNDLQWSREWIAYWLAVRGL